MAKDIKLEDSNGKKTSTETGQNSETVRQRSEKYQLKAAEPVRRNVLTAFLYGFSLPLRYIFQAIGSLRRFKVFRVLGKILLPSYFRNSWRELRLVTWPDRLTSWKLTYAVIIFSVLFGTIVAGVDYGLDKLFKEFIIK